MSRNPILALAFEPSLEQLGEAFWDIVQAADFPFTKLRFRNNELFSWLGPHRTASVTLSFNLQQVNKHKRLPVFRCRFIQIWFILLLLTSLIGFKSA